MDLCRLCNIHEPRNYYVWTHRQAVVRLILPKCDNKEDLLIKEKAEISDVDPSSKHYLEWLNC